MALRKSDLYGALWRSCDELRGGMDASQYKDYVLTLLFVKYVTDKATSDRTSLVDVPAGGSFDDMVACKGDREIGDKINRIVGRLAEANGLGRVVDLADFNDEDRLGKGKEMQDRLSKLVTIIADLDFRDNRAEGDDLLGDAYEYLMRHFARESGKSKGQFYTPAEVSRVLARLVGIGPGTRQDHTVYDPTCGSGSLLLKVAAEAPRGLTIYGQEKDNATWALARMNMILHGYEHCDIRKGDTIASPQFTQGAQLQTFDFAVANPPFSVKSWSNGLEHEYGRFDVGRPPDKNGDYAFLLHILTSLKSNGKAAVIMPHGVLFRGNAEAGIRKELLRRGYITGVIGLPANLFYGTGIPACMVVLDKEHAQERTSIFMIDASQGFIKDGSKNRLRSQDIHRIVDVFTRRTEVERYSRVVPLYEIADPKNDYNLNIARYITSSEPEDTQDLHAHLRGGIPDRDLDALGGFWSAFTSLRTTLFKELRPGYSDLAVDVTEVQQTVLDSAEFQKFTTDVRGRVDDWFAVHRPHLHALTEDAVPRDVIARMGDDLLARFTGALLLDKYDVYEQLMTYWQKVMRDDVFLVVNDGWFEAAQPRKVIEGNERKRFETPDLIVGSGRGVTRYKLDLIPSALVVSRYFEKEQVEVDTLNVAAVEAGRAVAEYIDEYATEDGLLAEAMDDGTMTKALASARLKRAQQEGADPEEVKVLHRLIELYNAEAVATKAVKEAQAALDLATLTKYGDLTMPEIQQLVIDDKWSAAIRHGIMAEVNTLILALVGRIQQLVERYAQTVGMLGAEWERCDAKVARHLADMGIER